MVSQLPPDIFPGAYQLLLETEQGLVGLLANKASDWPLEIDWLCRYIKTLLLQQLPPQNKDLYCVIEGKLQRLYYDWFYLLQQPFYGSCFCGFTHPAVSEFQRYP